jgi:putative SOS response-associated peptidase YedK
MTPEQSKTLEVGDRVCFNDDPAGSGKVTSVYGFLTTAPNAVVEQIHSKAMPVREHLRCCWGRWRRLRENK